MKRCFTLEYVKAAGVAMGIPGLTPHCLRGACATLLSLEGAHAFRSGPGPGGRAPNYLVNTFRFGTSCQKVPLPKPLTETP